MRRTDQEFREEILRRRKAYLARKRKRRNAFLTAAGCIALAFAGFFISLPMLASGGSAGSTAENQLAVDRSDENSVIMGDCEVPGAAPAEEPQSAKEAGWEDDVYGAIGYSTNGSGNSAPISLSEEDETVIASYLDGDWVDSLSDCVVDYVLVINGEIYHYSSSCGTFQNMELNCSLTVTEEERPAINEILERYKEP